MTHRLPNGYTHRPATTEDADRVATLWNDRSEATRNERPSTPERIYQAVLWLFACANSLAVAQQLL